MSLACIPAVFSCLYVFMFYRKKNNIVLFRKRFSFPCLSVQRDIVLLMKRELLLLQDVLMLKGETEKKVNWRFCVLKMAYGWRCLFEVGTRSNLSPLKLKLLFVLKDTNMHSPKVMLFPFPTAFCCLACGNAGLRLLLVFFLSPHLLSCGLSDTKGWRNQRAWLCSMQNALK